MTVGSLFSGFGGFDLGFERAGMTISWQVEIDEYCRQVLKRHWPTVPRFADVRDVSASNLATVDVICGGFPCQPFSVAGKRKGKSDYRWLWPDFSRVVDEIRPRWAVLENVPGLLTAESGECTAVITDLASLGYDAEWGCISASSFGSPYRRSRWFCVANNDGKRFSWGTKQDCESFLRKQTQRWGDAERCGTNVANIDSKGLSNEEQRQRTTKRGECESERQNRVGSITASIGRDQGRAQPNDRRETIFTGAGWWAVEPDVVRVVSGFPGRVDRIKGLGNAVIPIVAQYLATRLLISEQS